MRGLKLVGLGLGLVVGCSSDTPSSQAEPSTAVKDAGSSSAPKRDAGSTKNNDVGDAEAANGVVHGGGLPCDVEAVLSKHCWQCHGQTLKAGAPFSLVTRDDLQSAVKDQEGKSRIEVALARVGNDAMPMPPSPYDRLRADEIATLQSWFNAGAPASDTVCNSGTPTDDNGPGKVFPKPDDCENTYSVTAHGGTSANDTSKFAIGATPSLQGNQYQCFYFDPPYGDDQVMYWFDSVLDNIGILHHWILYGTENKTHASGTTAGCNAAEPGASFIAGWAPGGTNGAASGNVALELPKGPKAGLILEVHYFNNTNAPQQDASGIKFCTGKASGREHLAAVHTLGSEGICVQPGTQADVSAQCKPRTDMGDAHITGVWPHMHKSARHMKVSIKRADGSVDVIHDAPFDFNAQIYYPMTEDVVVHQGDTVETVCSYDNDTTSAIHYGERTQDEMCYAFTSAWPAGALSSPPSAFSNASTELGNHCQTNALTILQSCNGLADAPKNVTP